jgi:hypothetical protein
MKMFDCSASNMLKSQERFNSMLIRPDLFIIISPRTEPDSVPNSSIAAAGKAMSDFIHDN